MKGVSGITRRVQTDICFNTRFGAAVMLDLQTDFQSLRRTGMMMGMWILYVVQLMAS